MTQQRPERFAALRAEARRRIEARRRTIAELAHAAANEVDQRDPSPAEGDTAGEFAHDAASEARLFNEIAEWLEDDQLKTVTIDELMQLGAVEHDEEPKA